MSPSQHTKTLLSLYQIPPPLLRPCHACRILISVPLTLPKSLLMYPSAVSGPPFAATTSHGASLLLHSLYPCRKPQSLASTPPTPPLLPSAYQFLSPVSVFLLSWLHSTLPRFSRSRPSAAWPSETSPVWVNPFSPPPSPWTFPGNVNFPNYSRNPAEMKNHRIRISKWIFQISIPENTLPTLNVQYWNLLGRDHGVFQTNGSIFW